MQQPMSQAQHDQIAAQQAQQQMVLCPVRLVYETQILVQPGDQIQPNQTLFINPQNPPPWAQNRQVQQNPVIYVQQGNNIMPVQQHMDQQHLYLQQYQNFQQIIPQQMIQQQQENRQNQIQISNLIHQNMLANYQNIGQNIQLQQQDRGGMQQVTFAQTHPNVGANIQIQNQQQINVPNNNSMRQNETTVPNVQNVQVPQQNQISQRVEVKPTYQHANIGQQINQPPNMVRPQPQVLTVNPMQNLPQINIQTYGPNMINRPIKTENASSQVSMPTFVNAAQNTHITRIRKVAPAPNMNKMNTSSVGIRTVSQPYRPIQPRPQHQHYRHHFPNYPMEIQPQSTQSMPIINQNIININSNIAATQTVVPNIPTQLQNMIRPEENNRKRKSESPDEIHKKMAAIQVNSNVPIKQINAVQSTETGTNTSPVHKKEKLSMPLLFSNEKPPETNNMTTLIQNVQNAIKVDKVNMVKVTPNEELKDSTQNNVADKEKLVRNTVFTQARGRVLTEKELHNTAPITIVTVNPKDDKPLTMEPVKTEPDKIFKIPNPVTNDKVKDIVKTEPDKPLKITNAVTIERVKDIVKAETDKPFKITNVVKSEKDLDENKVEKKEREMNVSLNTTNNKGMFPMEKCEQEKDYILTHVLDGIVIQESNTAFPIREPLTRRVLHQTQASNDRKSRKSIKKEEKNNLEASKEPEKEIFPIGSVANDPNDEEKKQQELPQGDSDSPFLNLSPATLKSWTTTELAAHLTKHEWNEAAALFQEHEIDGESLFLVSKSQLQTIGVKENQAEVICAFVKS